MAQSANASPAKGFAAWQALTKALFDDYHPELHYMRGPGPKWHEKHGAEIDGASPAVTRALMGVFGRKSIAPPLLNRRSASETPLLAHPRAFERRPDRLAPKKRH